MAASPTGRPDVNPSRYGSRSDHRVLVYLGCAGAAGQGNDQANSWSSRRSDGGGRRKCRTVRGLRTNLLLARVGFLSAFPSSIHSDRVQARRPGAQIDRSPMRWTVSAQPPPKGRPRAAPGSPGRSAPTFNAPPPMIGGWSGSSARATAELDRRPRRSATCPAVEV